MLLLFFSLLGACTTLDQKETDSLFHLVPRTSWEVAKTSGIEYLPESFASERFIHLSPHTERLLSIANKYYAEDKQEFLILELDPQKILSPRVVIFEEGVPVKKKTSESKRKTKPSGRLWPHLYGGGILPQFVRRELQILRKENGEFYLP